jgi:hypothetical protein
MPVLQASSRMRWTRLPALIQEQIASFERSTTQQLRRQIDVREGDGIEDDATPEAPVQAGEKVEDCKRGLSASRDENGSDEWKFDW